MNHSAVAVSLVLLVLLYPIYSFDIDQLSQLLKPTTEYGGCINFSPYVDNLNPTWNFHPTPQLIETLLDELIATTPIKCILTYGVLNGLNHTFLAARNRGLKVIATIWLDGSMTPELNQLSIEAGIENVRSYSDVIEAVGCGIELLVRNSKEITENLITSCVTQFRSANLNKPIGASDTWYTWGNQKYPVEVWPMANQLLDFIGVNVYPWWETHFRIHCISSSDAPVFHVSSLDMIRKIYPTKLVYLHEYGWPAGSSQENTRVLRDASGAICSEASEENQNFVIINTIRLLYKYDLAGVPFASFREQWKEMNEGGVGPYWGICNGTAPYKCKQVWPTDDWETNLTVPGLIPVLRPPKPVPTASVRREVTAMYSPKATPTPTNSVRREVTALYTPKSTLTPTNFPQISPKLSTRVIPVESEKILDTNQGQVITFSVFFMVILVILVL